ncbi:2-oxoglutarate dehydrogenase complex dihydrolipoyllysine-residue succinyltransferase [Candidatus Venteria ishoeyi]|uniref:Dihydrolipoyllysine-residue succinyltransferase n=1 Tax=Candidatus Venteria ishoeyi TaxID=1899563 RepID=A0A1H6FEP2_9GAMM|nr:2-oxoglutarate dehydrogenase complex dihydrolipoyllysine-residue succinyltransferase [Candidatus Venteria ishoeyi]SEH08540.1 Dihydrolipoyllysine-residue succinyltransferase component of 2-oxoglutarate dehydrogenase complex [Candidatus Venteria ishoeyi]
MVQVKVPPLAESLTEAVVMEWVKQPGDWVKADEKLVDLETDKIVLEVVAPQTGRLNEILKPKDTVVGSEEVLAEIIAQAPPTEAVPVDMPEATEVEQDKTTAKDTSDATDSPEKIKIKVPALAENITQAVMLPWYKKPGSWVKSGDHLVEIETDGMVLEIVAPYNGQLRKIYQTEGDVVSSHDVLGDLFVSSEEMSSREIPIQVPPMPEIQIDIPENIEVNLAMAPKTGPAVRRMTTELGITPEQVPHHGDRVRREDVLNYQQQQEKQTPAPVTPVTPKPAPQTTHTKPRIQIPADPFGREQERVPMNRLRSRVSERLLEAQQNHAILTTFNEVNMQPIMDLRKQHQPAFEKAYDVRLGFMSFFVKAAIVALQKYPVLNASSTNDEIIYHGFYDIGIAVSTQRGLVVPVLRDADQLSFAQIEKNIRAYGQKAKENRLKMTDLEGGTFSITNGGIFGSMLSTPILNPPQSAILGMHNIVERPVAENGEVVIRPVMYIALSYDHRIIDGRDAVQGLVAIKQSLEDPMRLLLEL